MTELKEKIERWSREESLEAVTDRDDEGEFACIITLRELALSISLRSTDANRLLLSYTFEFTLPRGLAGGAERFVDLCENVVLSRSSLITCLPRTGETGVSAEVNVTLFTEGLTKQLLQTALEEVRKVGSLLGRALEAESLSAGVMADVQSIVRETSDALRSAVEAGATADVPSVVQEAVAIVEEAPAVVIEEPRVSVEEPAVEEPVSAVIEEAAPVVEAPPQAEPSGRFCTNCGAAIRGPAKFCRTCGARLED